MYTFRRFISDLQTMSLVRTSYLVRRDLNPRTVKSLKKFPVFEGRGTRTQKFSIIEFNPSLTRQYECFMLHSCIARIVERRIRISLHSIWWTKNSERRGETRELASPETQELPPAHDKPSLSVTELTTRELNLRSGKSGRRG